MTTTWQFTNVPRSQGTPPAWVRQSIHGKAVDGPRGSFETCLGPAVRLSQTGGGRRTPLGSYENVPRLQGAPPTRVQGGDHPTEKQVVTWQFRDVPRSGSSPPHERAEVGGHHLLV